MAGRWTLFIAISIALLWLCACGRPARAAAPPASAGVVAYEVALPDPASQYVHVRMHVSAPRGQRSNIAMPAWTPGSYLVRDFARHVYDLAASDDAGTALPVTRVDKQTWRVAHGGKPFAVTYRVFAADKSVRTSHVDDTHASLVGTSIFAYVTGELQRPA